MVCKIIQHPRKGSAGLLSNVKTAASWLTPVPNDCYVLKTVQARRNSDAGPAGFYEWGFLGALVTLCFILTALQYKWTGQISRAESARLNSSLRESLEAMCRAFDSDLTESCRALKPAGRELDELGLEAAHTELFDAWKTSRRRPLFSRVAFAIPEAGGLKLYELQSKEKEFSPLEWPKEWADLRENLSRKMEGPGRSPPFNDPSGVMCQFPIFGGRDHRLPPDGRGRSRPPGPGEREWAIFELDVDYLRNEWIPDLINKYLGQELKALMQDVQIKTHTSPARILYSSAGNTNEIRSNVISIPFNRMGGTLGGPGTEQGGRWSLEAGPRPGSIEALVAAWRRRNLTVAVGLNGLLLAAGLALVRYTRRSRMLAAAQMNFVANVSHELRTPLTVIRGAGHNLLKGVVHDRQQVEQYSRLIIQHADQLSQMMEQVLELGSAKNRPANALRQTVDIAKEVNEAVAATAEESTGCTLDVQVAPGLPQVVGDGSALRRAFQNLIGNAARHGRKGRWIGITAVTNEDCAPAMVEIQVVDRGEGIPQHELSEIFKPFFRGAKAQAQQVRGSGLGLSLVKEIVEGHGGTVSVESHEGQGATFTVRLPAANGKA